MITTDSNIRNESCALVYLMMPVYVLTARNTTVLRVRMIIELRLNSVRFTLVKSRLCLMKYPRDNDTKQIDKSSRKIIQRGTMLICLNEVEVFIISSAIIKYCIIYQHKLQQPVVFIRQYICN